MPSASPPPPEELAASVAALRDAAETTALRLSGDDVESDLQQLGDSLATLEERCAEVEKGATGRWKKRLAEARKHFHEARDLLDDGEPADAVALEVMAGREGLRN